MKLAQQTSSVAISGAVSSPSRFNIRASKEAFKILSSGLYNNKILAIIRELSCNAYDAHVAAGKPDTPFELHLPTTFEPVFTVLDTGTGLEYRTGGCAACEGTGMPGWHVNGVQPIHCQDCDGTGDYDAVKDLYCNYFASNKADSNLFIGALGLGSKSPFCYTEGFSIKNTYDGVTRVYSCFLNEEGMPAVLLQEVGETPNTPPGVEVSFPVQQKDVWEFENQAARALEFFVPRPIMNVNVNVNEVDYVMRAERWGLRKNDNLGGKVRAIQGFVAYSIGDIDTSKLTDDQRDLLALPLDLFFPIGELSVAASREALSNDDHTVKNILAALVQAKEHLLDDVKKQLSLVKTQWEARVLLYSLSNAQGIGKFVRRAHSSGDLDGLYQGWTLTSKDPSINQLDFPHVKIFEYTKTSRRITKPLKAELTSSTLPTPEQMQVLGWSNKKYQMDFSVRDNSAKFVINDIGFGGERYMKQLVQHDEDYTSGTAYSITRPGKEVTVETVVAEGHQIIEQLGSPPFMLLSQLREKYKAVMQRKPSTVRQLLWWDKTNYVPRERGGGRTSTPVAGWKKGWENGKDLQPSEDAIKYFVPVKKLVPMSGQFPCGYDFMEFVKSVIGLDGLQLKQEVIYGVPERYLEDLDDTWVNIVGHVMSKMAELMTPELEKQISLHLNPFRSTIERMIKKIGEEKLLPESSPLQQFANDLLTAEKYNKKQVEFLAVLISKAKELGVYQTTHSVDFNAQWEIVSALYPLLDQVSDYAFRTEKAIREAALEYINLIDERNANLQSVSDDFVNNQQAFIFTEETTANDYAQSN